MVINDTSKKLLILRPQFLEMPQKEKSPKAYSSLLQHPFEVMQKQQKGLKMHPTLFLHGEVLQMMVLL